MFLVIHTIRSDVINTFRLINYFDHNLIPWKILRFSFEFILNKRTRKRVVNAPCSHIISGSWELCSTRKSILNFETGNWSAINWTQKRNSLFSPVSRHFSDNRLKLCTHVWRLKSKITIKWADFGPNTKNDRYSRTAPKNYLIHFSSEYI